MFLMNSTAFRNLTSLSQIQSTSFEDSSTDSYSLEFWVIIASVVTIVIIAAIVSGVCFYCRRHRRNEWDAFVNRCRENTLRESFRALTSCSSCARNDHGENNRPPAEHSGQTTESSQTGQQSAFSKTGQQAEFSQTGQQSTSETGQQTESSNSGQQTESTNSGQQTESTKTGPEATSSSMTEKDDSSLVSKPKAPFKSPGTPMPFKIPSTSPETLTNTSDQNTGTSTYPNTTVSSPDLTNASNTPDMLSSPEHQNPSTASGQSEASPASNISSKFEVSSNSPFTSPNKFVNDPTETPRKSNEPKKVDPNPNARKSTEPITDQSLIMTKCRSLDPTSASNFPEQQQVLTPSIVTPPTEFQDSITPQDTKTVQKLQVSTSSSFDCAETRHSAAPDVQVASTSQRNLDVNSGPASAKQKLTTRKSVAPGDSPSTSDEVADKESPEESLFSPPSGKKSGKRPSQLSPADVGTSPSAQMGDEEYFYEVPFLRSCSGRVQRTGQSQPAAVGISPSDSNFELEPSPSASEASKHDQQLGDRGPSPSPDPRPSSSPEVFPPPPPEPAPLSCEIPPKKELLSPFADSPEHLPVVQTEPDSSATFSSDLTKSMSVPWGENNSPLQRDGSLDETSSIGTDDQIGAEIVENVQMRTEADKEDRINVQEKLDVVESAEQLEETANSEVVLKSGENEKSGKDQTFEARKTSEFNKNSGEKENFRENEKSEAALSAEDVEQIQVLEPSLLQSATNSTTYSGRRRSESDLPSDESKRLSNFRLTM